MTLKSIKKFPAPVLRKATGEIPVGDIPTAGIQRLISEMKKILSQASDGVGLAAPQIGVSLRIFLISSEAARIDANARGEPSRTIRMNANDANDKKQAWEYHVFINPVLKKQSRVKTVMAEGCLSLPGKFGEVARAEKVYLEWLDERGKKHSRGFAKFFARVIQHEMEHLGGILISDRAKKMFSLPPDGPKTV